MAFGWTYQVYLAGPGQQGRRVPGVRRGHGLPSAGHGQLWNGGCVWCARPRTPLGTAGDPSQGKDTENHGMEKLQEAQWSGRKCQAVHTRPQPPACLNLPPHPTGGTGTGWVSPRQKQDKLRLGKGGVTLGMCLTWARRRGRKKAYLYVCFTIYVRFLPMPDSVIKCFGVSFCFLMGNKWSKSIPSQCHLACDDGWRTFCFTSVHCWGHPCHFFAYLVSFCWSSLESIWI